MLFFGRVLFGTGIGAALMYFFDPERGARRRAQLRDRAVSTGGKLRDAADSTLRDIRNRTQGLQQSLRSHWLDESTDDDVLVERVRAAIGHAVSHPGAIEVDAAGGNVTLSGHVFLQELPLLIDRVYDVHGVRGVSNLLQAHASAERIPALQGPGRRPSPRTGFGFFQSNWSPAARTMAGIFGGIAAIYGIFERRWMGKVIGISGATLLARAATNLDLIRLTGISRKRFSISVQKSIDIKAPIERVFEIWANGANFPRFMTHVREVRPLDGGGRRARRWHWKVRGRSGMETEFTSQVTACEEYQLLAWRTEPGALVQHAGYVRFTPNGEHATKIDVRLAYTPVAGAVGHAIAKLLGDDPKQQMDDDLQRMKTFMETGITPRDAAIGTPRSSDDSRTHIEH
jgi:uncharacterized membrane protein